MPYVQHRGAPSKQCVYGGLLYLDVIGVCEKHGDSVNAHAPASCGGQPVFQGGAEVFIYEHGLIITSSLGLEENQTVTLFWAAMSLSV